MPQTKDAAWFSTKLVIIDSGKERWKETLSDSLADLVRGGRRRSGRRRKGGGEEEEERRRRRRRRRRRII